MLSWQPDQKQKKFSLSSALEPSPPIQKEENQASLLRKRNHPLGDEEEITPVSLVMESRRLFSFNCESAIKENSGINEQHFSMEIDGKPPPLAEMRKKINRGEDLGLDGINFMSHMRNLVECTKKLQREHSSVIDLDSDDDILLESISMNNREGIVKENRDLKAKGGKTKPQENKEGFLMKESIEQPKEAWLKAKQDKEARRKLRKKEEYQRRIMRKRDYHFQNNETIMKEAEEAEMPRRESEHKARHSEHVGVPPEHMARESEHVTRETEQVGREKGLLLREPEQMSFSELVRQKKPVNLFDRYACNSKPISNEGLENHKIPPSKHFNAAQFQKIIDKNSVHEKNKGSFKENGSSITKEKSYFEASQRRESSEKKGKRSEIEKEREYLKKEAKEEPNRFEWWPSKEKERIQSQNPQKIAKSGIIHPKTPLVDPMHPNDFPTRPYSLRMPPPFSRAEFAFISTQKEFTRNKINLGEMASEEQKLIRDNIIDFDLIVEAVAGAGKTTAALLVAQHWQNSKNGSSVMLTYNKRLKDETVKVATEADIRELEVHTLHSFCWKFYPGECSDDNRMSEIIEKKMRPKAHGAKKPNFNPTLFIFDEAQDFNELYFRLVIKILEDFNPNARIMILGDRFQMIYGYREADWRFFGLFDELLPKRLGGKSRQWKRLPLTTSYRLHVHMANFVNHVLLHQELIQPFRAVHEWYRPVYVWDNPFSIPLWKKLHKIIRGYIDSEIFVLSYSVKTKDSPIRRFANWLSDKGHHLHLAEDNETLSEKVMNGKIVVTTFHQSKGIQRKLVIIFGFDAYLLESRKNRLGSLEKPTDHRDFSACPNEVYVAVTRSIDKCIMIHSTLSPPLPCISLGSLSQFSEIWSITGKGPVTHNPAISFKDYVAIGSGGETSDEPQKPPLAFHIREMVSHLPYHVTRKSMDLFMSVETIRSLNNAFNKLEYDLPLAKQVGGQYESVSEINGLVLPLIAELKVRETATLLIDRVINHACNEFYKLPKTQQEHYEQFDHLGEATSNLLASLTRGIDHTLPSLSQTLFITNDYCCTKNGSEFKMKQIREYNWLTETQIPIFLSQLNFHLKEAMFNIGVWLKWEIPDKSLHSDIPSNSPKEKNFLILHGSIDILTDSECVLLKGSGSIRNEDILKAAMTAFLVENGGVLTRGFNTKMSFENHGHITTTLIEIMKHKYSKSQLSKRFVMNSLERVLEECSLMEDALKTTKRYIILNPYSGERVEVKFISKEMLFLAVKAIIEHKTNFEPDSVAHQEFIQKIKKNIE